MFSYDTARAWCASSTMILTERVVREALEAGAAERLDGSDHDARLRTRAAISLLDLRLDAGARELVLRLLEQLGAMGQEQDTFPERDPDPHERSSDDRLAGTGGKHEQRALAAGAELLFDEGD
jgi:hypothetical protein